MVVCGKDGGVFDMLDVFCEFCFWLRHMREHEFRGGAMTFVLRHSNILHYSFWSIITGKTRLNFKMPFSDNHGQNYWDNRLKITPEIKFPSEQSKSPPPSPQTMLMIICTNPCLLLIFFSQHWTGGEGGDIYLGNLVNCDDHVLLYTGVPMMFDQDCSSTDKPSIFGISWL